MNVEKFLERWRSYGPSKQLAILLAVLVKQHEDNDTPGSVTINMSDLDDISGGQTIIYREVGDKIHLLYSGEFTTLYTIQEAVHERSTSWAEGPPNHLHPQTDPANRVSPTGSDGYLGSTMDNERLADLEEKAALQGRLRNAARRVRSIELARTAPPSPPEPSRSAKPSPRRSPSPHRRPPSPAEIREQDQVEANEGVG